jgi:SAM-dependent methyltransferase
MTAQAVSATEVSEQMESEAGVERPAHASIAFDRAAESYDATRGFPPGVGDQVVEALAPHLARPARVVEVGVGTGRIARLLLERGLPVIGVDLSRAMMDRLRRAPPRVTTARLIQGDAGALPMAAGWATAVIAVHVFHLVGDAPRAMHEALRVLNPQGVVAIGWNWHPGDSIGRRVRREWRAIVARHGADLTAPGLRNMEAPVEFFRERARRHAEILACEWPVTRSPREAIADVEKKTFSSSWVVGEEDFPACLEECRHGRAQVRRPGPSARNYADLSGTSLAMAPLKLARQPRSAFDQPAADPGEDLVPVFLPHVDHAR